MAKDAGLICDEILEELCIDLDNPDSVDYAKAEELILAKLAPVLACAPGLVASPLSAGKLK